MVSSTDEDRLAGTWPVLRAHPQGRPHPPPPLSVPHGHPPHPSQWSTPKSSLLWHSWPGWRKDHRDGGRGTPTTWIRGPKNSSWSRWGLPTMTRNRTEHTLASHLICSSLEAKGGALVDSRTRAQHTGLTYYVLEPARPGALSCKSSPAWAPSGSGAWGTCCLRW